VTRRNTDSSSSDSSSTATSLFRSAIHRLKTLAESQGFTLNQLALAWLLSSPAVTSVIIGASTPEQIRQNTTLLKDISKETLEECSTLTEDLKQKLGANPDMWAKTSRYQ
jgi:aryl-alcohol dehydrogenase-like predicted oxidoreductase